MSCVHVRCMESTLSVKNYPSPSSSWKDPSNDFKKTLKLTGVPTLLRYGTVSILPNQGPDFKSGIIAVVLTLCIMMLWCVCVNNENVLYASCSLRSWWRSSVSMQTWCAWCSQKISATLMPGVLFTHNDKTNLFDFTLLFF